MKTNILLLFGGVSSEHDVSLMSAATMDNGLNRDKYTVHKVYISKDGLWRYYEGDIREINEEELIRTGKEAALLPGSKSPVLLVFDAPKAGEKETLDGCTAYPVDFAIPAMHGRGGEDGTMQGLFEIARIPYAGCGVLASAASMDKITTKRIVAGVTKIRQAKCVSALRYELEKEPEEVLNRVEAALPYPVYVKPSNAGSSVGVSRAANREELYKALQLAAENDSRLLIEEEIVGREIECAVLGNTDHVRASGVGEILAADTFYTYDAKYNNPDSSTVLDPDLPAETVEEIRADAKEIFRAVGGRGYSRVDFFVERSTGEVVFNEINTLPGFTHISMYPQLWIHKGMTLEELMDELIRLGMEK